MKKEKTLVFSVVGILCVVTSILLQRFGILPYPELSLMQYRLLSGFVSILRLVGTVFAVIGLISAAHNITVEEEDSESKKGDNT